MSELLKNTERCEHGTYKFLVCSDCMGESLSCASSKSNKCKHGMMPWECFECTSKAELIKIKNRAKLFIDANVWDGEDRSGAKNDNASFSPDDLQELVDELVEELYGRYS